MNVTSETGGDRKMSIYDVVFRVVVLVALGSALVIGGIAHMMLKAEIKEIKRELMQKDADIKRLERRIY